jgi:hypothetical protein
MATEPTKTPLSALQLLALASGSISADRISTRPGTGGGKALSYVEAYDIRATLNKVFGFAEWSYVVEQAEIVQVERDIPKADGKVTAFRVTAMVRSKIIINQTGVEYGGVAVSSQNGSQIGEVADFAMKTADSDALKRAAMNLGTQFGLSLYNDGSRNDVVKMGLAPGQEWNVPAKLAEKAGERLKALEAGGVPPGPSQGSAEGQELVARALRMQAEKAAAAAEVPGDDVPMYADPSLDSSMDGAEAHS